MSTYYHKSSITFEMLQDFNFIDVIANDTIKEYERMVKECPKSIHFAIDYRRQMVNVIVLSSIPEYVFCWSVDKHSSILEVVQEMKELNPHIVFGTWTTGRMNDDIVHNIMTIQLPIISYAPHSKYRC